MKVETHVSANLQDRDRAMGAAGPLPDRGLLDLPDELVVKIIALLDSPSVCRLATTRREIFAKCQANSGLMLPHLLASALRPPQNPANQELRQAARNGFHNWLAEYPVNNKELDLLANLQHIGLRHFALEDMDAERLLDRFPRLRSVDLQGNDLTYVSDRLAALDSANLRDNRIDRVDVSVEKMLQGNFNLSCNPWSNRNT